MKLLIASMTALALVAAPAAAQETNTPADQPATATTTHVKTTTRHVHATNVPVRHHAKRRHHAVRCGCPSSYAKGHHAKTHHVKKITTTTTTKS